MIDKEIITKNEAENDGKTIYLYYDDIAGMYMAFGLSAYYTTMVTDPYMSFSEAFQMPVALLRREHVLYLRQSLKIQEHTPVMGWLLNIPDFYGFITDICYSHTGCDADLGFGLSLCPEVCYQT